MRQVIRLLRFCFNFRVSMKGRNSVVLSNSTQKDVFVSSLSHKVCRRPSTLCAGMFIEAVFIYAFVPGGLSGTRLRDCALHMAKGLEHLHKHGVLHKDIALTLGVKEL